MKCAAIVVHVGLAPYYHNCCTHIHMYVIFCTPALLLAVHHGCIVIWNLSLSTHTVYITETFLFTLAYVSLADDVGIGLCKHVRHAAALLYFLQGTIQLYYTVLYSYADKCDCSIYNKDVVLHVRVH